MSTSNMNTATFADYEAAMRSEGFDEVIERSWAPGQVIATHGHPFAARAVVTRGEMWLTQAGQERRLGPGDTFSLAENEPHAERYGAEGAAYWVARKRG